jgi:hypothetical protein
MNEPREGSGGRRRIRTFEGVSQQIYSLPPLATWVSYRPVLICFTLMTSALRALVLYCLRRRIVYRVYDFSTVTSRTPARETHHPTL